MEEHGSGGFAMDGEEPQLRSIITRSSSSQPLLESAPYSHCVAAAAIGDKAAGSATPEKVGMVAYQHDVEAMMAGRERVVPVAGHDKPFLTAGIQHDGCGEHVKSSVWGYVGRLFHHKDGSEGPSGKEATDSSSQEDGEEDDKEQEGKKGKKKKKKRSAWLPDPDKRWPIQGFY